jgi:hypothetical protein
VVEIEYQCHVATFSQSNKVVMPYLLSGNQHWALKGDMLPLDEQGDGLSGERVVPDGKCSVQKRSEPKVLE